MRQLALSFLVLLQFSAQAQLNIDSISHVDYMALHSTMINDIWGYTDEFGNEYALVGTEEGTSVVDLSDPYNPIEIFWEPGMTSVWRDIKTVGDYAYVTTEALNGLLIIDLSPLPSSTNLPVAYYTGPNGSEWQSAHNLYADDNGLVFIFGANRGNGGAIILDVQSSPMNPVEVGDVNNYYVHDGYAINDTLYLANIMDGFFSMFDISNPASPVLLGTKNTPSDFTHNIWKSDFGPYVFTTDEVSGGFVGAYDISNPLNIVELDRVQSSPGSGVIPHNTHVLGNHIITSWYSDGVVIHDVTYPYNMIEVGNYDTYPMQTASYDGCWGAYPYLPSGLLLATDRTEGLYVLSPTYEQAAYLEGTVTDASSSNPISLADITIGGVNISDNSQLNGFYATGTVASGTYDVTYDKVGYYVQTIPTTLTQGIIVTQDVQLVPIPPYNLTINVFEDGTSTPISGADILLTVPQLSHNGQTNGLGQEVLTLYYEDIYNVSVGKWGYITYCDNIDINNTTGSINVYLRKGYYDDFTFDYNWMATSTASTGDWVRDVPFGTNGNANPSSDVINDCGERAFVTGNANDLYIDGDDVDNGYVTLYSPLMDLTTYSDPYLNFSQWFFCYYGPQAPNDSLRVRINNGSTMVQITTAGHDPNIDPMDIDWEEKSFRILDYTSLSSTMQVSFVTSDLAGSANITEVGVDRFFIAEADELGIDNMDTDLTKIRVYPNPFDHSFSIIGLEDGALIEVVDINGSVLLTTSYKESMSIDLQHLNSGFYFVRSESSIVKVTKL